MVSRENRTLTVTTVVAAVVGVAVGALLPVTERWASLLGVLAFVGVGLLLPQLYLARTDDAVDPERRVRIGVGLSIVFLWLVGPGDLVPGGLYGTVQGRGLLAVGGLLFASLVAYEAWVGYREVEPRRSP